MSNALPGLNKSRTKIALLKSKFITFTPGRSKMQPWNLKDASSFGMPYDFKSIMHFHG
jgi:hypothetical protein